MNPFKTLENYRSFKANNRYSYPFFFFAVAALKNLFQFTALVIAGWAIFQIADGNHVTQPMMEQVVQSPVVSKTEPVVQQFNANVSVDVLPTEILAAGSKQQGSLNSPTVDVSSHDSTPAIIEVPRRIVSWTWVLKQDEDKYTIQYGSSPDKIRIRSDAASFPTTEAVVVFPFKKTPSNRTVYGFSTGLYSSVEDAQLAIENLPASARSFGPWIRPIEDLQKQVVSTLAK